MTNLKNRKPLSSFNFPSISAKEIDGDTIQTVNARDLHGYLEPATRFNDWITSHIEQYGFVKNQDFTIFTENSVKIGRGRPAKEYALTLDMAKEIAMVDRSEKGRIVRKYFIQCEKIVKSSLTRLDAETLEMIKRSDGICRMLSHKVTLMEKAIELLTHLVQPNQPVVIVQGKTAGEILRDNGFGGVKGLAGWLGNRLETFGCRISDNGRGYLGVSRARLFDPNKSDLYLKNGGKSAIRQKIQERQGQGKLRLVAMDN